MRNRLPGCLALVLLAGCSSRPMPVRLEGDPVSIAWLAGDWTGQYWNESSPRRGSLSFFLQSGTDSLFGDVMMADEYGNVVVPADRPGEHMLHVRQPQRLRIDFVTVRADSVRGMLEPYVSPECQCAVTTTFLGRVEGDEITGTYQSRDSNTRRRGGGSWRMTRVGPTRRAR